jgi:Ubiquitin-like modifier-activating enzyme ATG7 N-terminus
MLGLANVTSSCFPKMRMGDGRSAALRIGRRLAVRYVSQSLFACFIQRSHKQALQRILGFIDPSADPSNPGWPLRNLLAYLHAVFPSSSSSVKVLRWRDVTHVKVGTVSLAAPTEALGNARPGVVGWERNPAGKLGARVADLAPMMDPTRCAFVPVALGSREKEC